MVSGCRGGVEGALRGCRRGAGGVLMGCLGVMRGCGGGADQLKGCTEGVVRG